MIVFVTTKLSSNRDLGIEIILEILSLITNTNPNKIQEIIKIYPSPHQKREIQFVPPINPINKINKIEGVYSKNGNFLKTHIVVRIISTYSWSIYKGISLRSNFSSYLNKNNQLIIPFVVLKELEGLSLSTDIRKKESALRGYKIFKKLQKNGNVTVRGDKDDGYTDNLFQEVD